MTTGDTPVWMRVSLLSITWPRTFGSKGTRLRAAVWATHRSPVAASTAMLVLVVPTARKLRVTASDVVSISTTSLSGSVYGICAVHAGSVASTIRPTFGGAGSAVLV